MADTQPQDTIVQATSDGFTDAHPLKIARLWRRGVAIFLDMLMLSIPFFILGVVFRNLAYSIGPYGRIIGYGVLVTYLTFFNSNKGSGQTLGKRALKIEVVNTNNEYLTLRTSFFRSLILVAIPLFNNWALPQFEWQPWRFIIGIIIFGGLLGMAYSLIFNRTTRQGLHDLVVSTVVIDKNPDRSLPIPETPLVHKRIAAGLIFLTAIYIAVINFSQDTPNTFGVLEENEWNELVELQTSLMEGGDYFMVSVHRNNNFIMGQDGVARVLVINMWAKQSCVTDPDYCNEQIVNAAHTALEKYAGIENLSGMQVGVTNAFDFGLASGHISNYASLPIEQWLASFENSP